jgi:hypothetical protein
VARRRTLLRWYAVAGGAATIGVGCGVLGVGVALARLGVTPAGRGVVVATWIILFVSAALVVAWTFARRASVAITRLAAVLELRGGRRRGSIAGVAAGPAAQGSAALFGLADRRQREWLDANGAVTLAAVDGAARRSVALGAAVLVGGVALLGAAGPRTAAARPFFRPSVALGSGAHAVTLAVDRTTVRRGESVSARVTAPGVARVVFAERAIGERWVERTVALDSAGGADVRVGPLDADRFIAARTGDATSDTIAVRVTLPALLESLEMTAHFPPHVGRDDRPLDPATGKVTLPVGTRIVTRGVATVPLRRAVWRDGRGTAALAVRGSSFSGTFSVVRSGDWRLEATPVDGDSLDEPAPRLEIVALPDSAPVVAIPVPGADTTLPTTLRQALVVDARDDHGLRALDLITWRVSRLGVRSPEVVQALPVAEDAADRAVVQWVLDLNARGLLPGDTAYVQARAVDNAPTPHQARSRAWALRLPSLTELRAQARQDARAVAAAGDSIVRRQEELARGFDELATERERTDAPTGRGAVPEAELPYASRERAQALLAEQEAVRQRAEELRDELRAVSEAAWEAGITDPEFHRQMAELRTLLDQALTEALADRLDRLRAALGDRDAAEMRDALRDLAGRARALTAAFERNRTLLARAALEGDLTTLAQDADELATRQREWTDDQAARADSAAAAAERDLAREADSLVSGLERAERALDSLGFEPSGVPASRRASTANAEMERAANAADRADARGARDAGEEAWEALQGIGEELRSERDNARARWREEVAAELERAMVETAALAERQDAVTRRLTAGEGGADLRAEQGAVREGVDRVAAAVEDAAGKHALVSPALGTALGLARRGMDGALEALVQPRPSAGAAAGSAGAALESLNAAIHALLESRDAVSGAGSGTGFAEAVERLARLAEQQGGLAGAAGGLLPGMGQGGEALRAQLAALAERQRRLAEALERLGAQGSGAAEGLAPEAQDIARALEQGQLDRGVVERQERLYRRLLDAGRTLTGNEEDENRERTSETARPGEVHRPDRGPVPITGPRFPVPSWDALRGLSPEERRMVLEYFRRLNSGGR